MSETRISGAYRAWVLFILVTVYTFNFIDRQIVGILAVPVGFFGFSIRLVNCL